MLRLSLFAVLLIVVSSNAKALTEARLLNKSSTGQTVIFNLGSQDGIQQGDYAVVVRQIRPTDSREMKVVPVAKARNIKMNSDSSVWILYKVFDHDLLIRGAKYNVLTESHLLRGRKKPRIDRVTVVGTPEEINVNAREAESNDRDKLSKLKDKYEVITPTHEQKVVSDADAEIIDLEEWKKVNGTRYRSPIYRSANKEEFERHLRLSTFQKIVTAYLARVNDPKFNYDSFYEKQRKTLDSNEFSAHAHPDSEYSRFLRKESSKATADAKLYRSILEQGGAWSQEYSDEELRNVLNQVSILQEKDRRVLVVSKPTRFSSTLDYGFTMSDGQTDKDPSYQRESLFSTELDFEVVPFLKHDALERFTLTTSFRLNYTAFEASDFNADLNEYTVSLGANWYPLYASYVVGAPIFFLGTYVRTGFGSAYVPSMQERANYTVLAAPGFRAGFKYILRNRIGIRIAFNMESLELERYELDTVGTVLPANTKLVEAKVGVGLGYAF